jgi:hypothetical protein
MARLHAGAGWHQLQGAEGRGRKQQETAAAAAAGTAATATALLGATAQAEPLAHDSTAKRAGTVQQPGCRAEARLDGMLRAQAGWQCAGAAPCCLQAATAASCQARQRQAASQPAPVVPAHPATAQHQQAPRTPRRAPSPSAPPRPPLATPCRQPPAPAPDPRCLVARAHTRLPAFLPAQVGWKHSEAVAELEANRKAKAAEYYATKRKQLALLAKAAAKVRALRSLRALRSRPLGALGSLAVQLRPRPRPGAAAAACPPTGKTFLKAAPLRRRRHCCRCGRCRVPGRCH